MTRITHSTNPCSPSHTTVSTELWRFTEEGGTMAFREFWASKGRDVNEVATSGDESAVPSELGNFISESQFLETLQDCEPYEMEESASSLPSPTCEVPATEDDGSSSGTKWMSGSSLSLATCSMPATEEYPGPHSFEIRIAGSSSGTKWMFSHVMNKLFITLNTVIDVGFKCDNFGADLFVRALLVYCDPEEFYEPVVRCLCHQSKAHSDNAGIGDALINHVLHINDSGAIYERNDNSGRYSVRMPLSPPQAETDWVTVGFKFMCKNSCSSGLNRRPTEVIFTLENERGAVLGRRKMKVRICSFPKRDMTKAENWKSHAFFPQVLLGEAAFLDVTICEQARMMKILQAAKRQPTRKEAALLKKYERDLEHGFSPGN